MEKDTSTKTKYHDVVTIGTPLVKSLSNAKQISTLSDPKLFPIVKILRKGPMTVEEIAKNYEDKSQKSIYRYLQELKKADLVQECGQRVIEYQTATKKLYSRTAKIFLIKDNDKKIGECEKSIQIVSKSTKILNFLYPDLEIDENCLQKWYSHFFTEAGEDIERYLHSNDSKALEIIAECEWSEVTDLFKSLSIFAAFIKIPDAQETFFKCFTKKNK